MPDADRYIAGVPCWIDSSPADPDASVAFYSGLFGWECENALGPDGPGRYYMARQPGGDVAAISSPPEGAPASAAWHTYIWVDDADVTAKAVATAGGTVVMEPTDVGDAGRMAVFADAEGAAFSVWQAGQHRGAAVVNEHGSVNFNDLHTRDPEAAAAFYGAVFGWEVLDLGGGLMWVLPGYCDFLERRTPGLRASMKEMGAPAGFEDVVASLALLTDDAIAPHWGVTFAVDDADAAAARAVELGGRVVVPPMDAPWVRLTVITDPQGATFTASAFVPENKDVIPGAGAVG